MRKQGSTLLFLLSMLMLLSGCWDVQEISQRGIANVVFFDTGNVERVKMGVVLAIPGTALPPTVGTMQQFLQRHFVVTGEGSSVVEAWTEIQASTVRNIFFGQTRAIILSEELARENINDALDFIGRIPLIPPNAHVLVAKEKPSALMELDNWDNYLPGEYIDIYFRSHPVRALAIPTILWQVNSAIDGRVRDPHLPLIQASGQETYRIAGTALFSQERMVGELGKNQTQLLALLKGTDMGYVTVPLDQGGGGMIAFWNVSSQSRIKPTLVAADSLSLDIHLDMEGRVAETHPQQRVDWHTKQQIEEQVERFLRGEMENLISTLQSLVTDPAGFAQKFQIAYPREWQTIDWNEVYPTVDITVSVNFTIRETGLHR